jgi:signal peptidase I
VTSRSDEEAEAAVVERLAQGTGDVCDLADAVSARLGDGFRREEGGLHAVLQGLLSRRAIEVSGRSDRGGATYRAASPNGVVAPSAWDEALPAPAPPPPASPRASRIALRVASGASDAEDRGRVTSDVLAHLQAIGASGRTRAFGSVAAAREALRRADRGRARVAIAATVGERLRRFAVHELPGFLVAAAAFALTWIFLLEPRRIPSRSMEPTLLEGDRILVWKVGAHEVPERWTVMTFENRAGETLIKRVVGLPGEHVKIEDGDVYADGVLLRKPDDLRERMKRRVLGAGPFGRAPPQGWVVDASGSYRLASPLHLEDGEVTERLTDLYLDARVPPGVSVELAIESNVRDVKDATVVMTLRHGPGGSSVSVAAPGQKERVAVAPASAAPREEHGVSLSIVDGVLRAGVPGWSHEMPVEVRRSEAKPRVRGPVLSLEISRDLHYTERGEYAIEPAFAVPEGMVFMLGDRSHDSRDSRYRLLGPIPLARLTGKAVFRVWPPLRVGPIR